MMRATDGARKNPLKRIQISSDMLMSASLLKVQLYTGTMDSSGCPDVRVVVQLLWLPHYVRGAIMYHSGAGPCPPPSLKNSSAGMPIFLLTPPVPLGRSMAGGGVAPLSQPAARVHGVKMIISGRAAPTPQILPLQLQVTGNMCQNVD